MNQKLKSIARRVKAYLETVPTETVLRYGEAHQKLAGVLIAGGVVGLLLPDVAGVSASPVHALLLVIIGLLFGCYGFYIDSETTKKIKKLQEEDSK